MTKPPTCKKVPHTGTGYLHDEDDDSPYDVDGVMYCGRCHFAMDFHRDAPKPKQPTAEPVGCGECEICIKCAMAQVDAMNTLRATIERLEQENRRVWAECARLAKLTGGPGMTLNEKTDE